MPKKIREIVQDEAFLIEDSGEMPEVNYWNSLYFLCQDQEGPKLKLTPEEKLLLKKAVVKRYLTIIERDLTVENMNKSFYRGVSRAIVNWQRLQNFLRKEGWSEKKIKKQILSLLEDFLKKIEKNKLQIDVSPQKLCAFWNSLKE